MKGLGNIKAEPAEEQNIVDVPDVDDMVHDTEPMSSRAFDESLIGPTLICHEVYMAWSRWDEGRRKFRFARLTLSKEDSPDDIFSTTTGEVLVLKKLDKLRCTLYNTERAGDLYYINVRFKFKFARIGKFVKMVSSRCQ